MLAFEVIVQLAMWYPQLIEKRKLLGATNAAALSCIREEQEDASDYFLSPSRKALIYLVESELNTMEHDSINLYYQLTHSQGTKVMLMKYFIYANARVESKALVPGAWQCPLFYQIIILCVLLCQVQLSRLFLPCVALCL